jgi:gamma-glutamyltranspeptidase
MTVRHPNGSSLAFNFREMAPAAAFKHMYDQAPLASQFGGLAAGVPGELAGLEEAFKRYTSGKLSWAELFAPVIALNRNGFTVGKALGRAIELAAPALTVNPSQWKWLYVLDGDKEYGQQWRLAREGDVIRRKNLSKTLELIARNGSSAIFYDPNGSIVHNLVNTVQRMGGIMTPEDFANYSVVVSEPLRMEFMGREVLTTPNPSSGPALVMALKTMQYLYEDDDSHFQDDFDPVATQRLVEVMKWMAAARTELGDSAETVNPKIQSIMSDEWAYNVSRHVSDSHTLANWTEYDPSYEPAESHGTAHFSIIDEDGMAVSMTTTVNLYFGAMIADPVTGIVINSEMDDFSLPSRDNAYDLRPSVYNYVGPRKRPLSSTVPTIVSYEDEVELVIGAAGGSRIVTAVLQAIVRTYIYGESMLRTIARPRLHHQLLPETAFLELGTPSDVVYELESRGHNVTLMNPVTAMNGILRDETGAIYAVSDFWRKGGLAAGY